MKLEYNWSLVEASAIFMIGCIDSTITKATVNHNTAEKGTMTLTYTNMELSDSNFWNNTSKLRTNNIFASYSILDITDTYFGSFRPKRKADFDKMLESIENVGDFLFLAIDSVTTLTRVQLH